MSTSEKLLDFSLAKRLPVILQSEVAECGTACVAMVASFHGHHIDLATLRRLYPTSLKGVALSQLIQLSEKLALSSRPVRVELDQLDGLQLPCILHWDMNHFVVLKSVARQHVIIHDPAVGQRKLSKTEFGNHFTGVALELTPSVNFSKKEPKQSMSLFSLWKNTSGLLGTLVQLFVLSLVLQLFAVAAPFYVQLVVDEVIVSHDRDFLQVLAIGFAVIVLVNVLVSALRSYVAMFLSNTLSLQMAMNLFRHLLKLPLDFFEKRHIGDIVSRFGSLTAVKEFITRGVVGSVVDGIMAVLTLVMMFLYSPLLTVVVLSSVSIYVLSRLTFYHPLKMRTEESVVAGAKENSNFMETVRGMQSIKIFGREQDRKNIWVRRYADLINSEIRLSKLRIGFDAFNGGIYGIENILVIFIAANLVLDNALSVGMLMAFIAYKMQFTAKATELLEQYIKFKMLSVHLNRISDIALAVPEQHVEGENAQQRNIQGELQLTNVAYRYSDSDPYLFKDVQLTIRRGERVALIGPSGTGKSTLMKVMMGLLTAQQGSVLIDGVALRELGLRNYREQVAAVMQDDQLFAGSIADNICLFDAEADQQKIQQCAKLAAIDEDIQGMPMAYNSLVGDMGTTLSGGQKQRVLLARALYRDPVILFLDEASSHLDTRAEERINQNLSHLQMTTIVIAHRPETIRWADRVVVLNQGVLQELHEQSTAREESAPRTCAL